MGMKWGKGKSSSNDPNKRRMSNKELESRIKRLKMEQEFSKLTEKPKSKSKIDSVVKGAATVAALSASAVTIYTNLDKIAKAAKAAQRAAT